MGEPIHPGADVRGEAILDGRGLIITRQEATNAAGLPGLHGVPADHRGLRSGSGTAERQAIGQDAGLL